MFFIWVIIVLFFVEKAIKEAMDEKNKEGVKIPIIGGRLYLTKYHNYGMALDSLERKPWIVKWISLVLSTVCTVIFCITLGHKGKVLLKSGLAILLGGAYSNTYDRVKRGFVIDYFGFQVRNKWLRNLVFNVADFCILVGVLIASFLG